MKKECLILALLIIVASLNAAGEEKIPGQRPMLVIEDTFQFIPGAWTVYTITDKTKNEGYKMYIATLEKERYEGKPCAWMEVEVEMKDNPSVVTRFLTEETKSGPGKLLKIIVQVKGYSPFNVPKKYFQGADKEVGDFETAQIVKRLEKKTIRHKGKSITAWVVEAESNKGEQLSAMVSEELPPIAVYQAETKELDMTAEDWGVDAKTKIKGTPVSFTIWIMEQLFKGLIKEEKKGRPLFLPSPTPHPGLKLEFPQVCFQELRPVLFSCLFSDKKSRAYGGFG